MLDAVAGLAPVRRREELLADRAVDDGRVLFVLVRRLRALVEGEFGLASTNLKNSSRTAVGHLEVARDVGVLRAVVDRELEEEAARVERGREARERSAPSTKTSGVMPPPP